MNRLPSPNERLTLDPALDLYVDRYECSLAAMPADRPKDARDSARVERLLVISASVLAACLAVYAAHASL